jgi:hypothetical protein
MTPTHLTLAAVAALAAAGAARRRGSRAEQALEVTRAGWPFPPRYRMFHATAGLQSILRDGRFKTRRQEGVATMTGGGPNDAISLTIDPRVADAILVGLTAMRQIARGEMTLIDLWDRFSQECPKAAQKIATTKDAEYNRERARRMDEGLLVVSDGLGEPLQSGWIPIGGTWEGAGGVTYTRRWWQRPETGAQRAEQRERYAGYIVGLYNWLTSMGSATHECYWPTFWGTDTEALAAMPADQLGFMEVETDMDRIAPDPTGLVQMGYLSMPVAKSWKSFLSRIGDRMREHARGDRYRSDWSMFDGYGWPTDKKVGPWSFLDVGEATPETTMVWASGMAEVRVFAPRKIRILSTQTAEARLRQVGLEGRVTHPYFGSDLPSSRVPPGKVLLGEW